MRWKVHLLNRFSGRVLPAELNMDNRDAWPVFRVEGRLTDDAERFELLPLPMEDELGTPSFDWGTP